MDKVDFIKQQGDTLFTNRTQLINLWQEIAENFYPERADFTSMREPSDEFCGYLDTSYPVLCRRDLGNQIGGMLRPTNKEWFKIIKQYDDLDTEGKQWAEWASKIMKRVMYDPVANFSRATKEGDHDWATFGQAPLSCRINWKENALLYRSWHLRDVAWKEDYKGAIGTVFRKWKTDAITLNAFFKDKLHKKVIEALSKKPFDEFEIWHAEIPSEILGDSQYEKFPLVSLYYDVTNKHIIEEVGISESEYIIPRWQTISGSQYAFSPATIIALPDARLIQSIARVLMDASEMAIRPPMIAIKEAIRGDISIYPAGITYTDADYDERTGDVLRQLEQKGKVPIGFEMSADVRNLLSEAFYLNKLSLPPPTPNATAYEISERVAEYIRQALPLFEPMEDEYNAKLCDKTFSLCLKVGVFGDPRTFPKSVYGGIKFQFESPLREAVDKVKGQKFIETGNLVKAAMELDQSAGIVMDVTEALKDTLDGIGSPAKWRRTDSQMVEFKQTIADQQVTERVLTEAQQGMDVAKTANDAGLL